MWRRLYFKTKTKTFFKTTYHHISCSIKRFVLMHHVIWCTRVMHICSEPVSKATKIKTVSKSITVSVTVNLQLLCQCHCIQVSTYTAVCDYVQWIFFLHSASHILTVWGLKKRLSWLKTRHTGAEVHDVEKYIIRYDTQSQSMVNEETTIT